MSNADVSIGAIPILPQGIPVTAAPRMMDNPDEIRLIATRQRFVPLSPSPDIVANGIEVQLGFPAACVVVQNPTPYWWYIPEAALWIPPYTINLSHNFTTPQEKAHVLFTAPVDRTQPAVATTASVAGFTYLDTPQQPTTLIAPEAVAITGTVATEEVAPTTAATSSVAVNIADVQLLAANAARLGATVFNDSMLSTLYVKFGAAASLTSFKVAILPGGFYELPFPVYTGQIRGIWSVADASGAARISEET